MGWVIMARRNNVFPDRFAGVLLSCAAALLLTVQLGAWGAEAVVKEARNLAERVKGEDGPGLQLEDFRPYTELIQQAHEDDREALRETLTALLDDEDLRVRWFALSAILVTDDPHYIGVLEERVQDEYGFEHRRDAEGPSWGSEAGIHNSAINALDILRQRNPDARSPTPPQARLGERPAFKDLEHADLFRNLARNPLIAPPSDLLDRFRAYHSDEMEAFVEEAIAHAHAEEHFVHRYALLRSVTSLVSGPAQLTLIEQGCFEDSAARLDKERLRPFLNLMRRVYPRMPETRIRAADTLAELYREWRADGGSASEIGNHAAALDRLAEALTWFGAPGASRLLDLPFWEHPKAAEQLLDAGSRWHVRPLLEAFAESPAEDHERRLNVLSALAHDRAYFLGEVRPMVRGALLPYFDDEAWERRKRAAEIAGITSDPFFLPELQRLASSDTHAVEQIRSVRLFDELVHVAITTFPVRDAALNAALNQIMEGELPPGHRRPTPASFHQAAARKKALREILPRLEEDQARQARAELDELAAKFEEFRETGFEERAEAIWFARSLDDGPLLNLLARDPQGIPFAPLRDRFSEYTEEEMKAFAERALSVIAERREAGEEDTLTRLVLRLSPHGMRVPFAIQAYFPDGEPEPEYRPVLNFVGFIHEHAFRNWEHELLAAEFLRALYVNHTDVDEDDRRSIRGVMREMCFGGPNYIRATLIHALGACGPAGLIKLLELPWKGGPADVMSQRPDKLVRDKIMEIIGVEDTEDADADDDEIWEAAMEWIQQEFERRRAVRAADEAARARQRERMEFPPRETRLPRESAEEMTERLREIDRIERYEQVIDDIHDQMIWTRSLWEARGITGEGITERSRLHRYQRELEEAERGIERHERRWKRMLRERGIWR